MPFAAEDQRQPLYHAALKSGELGPGVAVGNLQSVHFERKRPSPGAEPETHFVRAISPVENGLALTVEAFEGKIIETPLPITVLETTRAAVGSVSA